MIVDIGLELAYNHNMGTNLTFRVWDEKYNNWDNDRFLVYPDHELKIQGRVIQMSIGLRDRDKTLIFEGDILEGDNRKYTVVWVDDVAGFKLINPDGFLYDISEIRYSIFSVRGSKLKIVGNIFEGTNT